VIDRFDATLLAAFDIADSKADESAMREAAEASWVLSISTPTTTTTTTTPDTWELPKTWAEKLNIFYSQDSTLHNPLLNFTEGNNTLDFDAMDAFMAHIFSAIREHGSRAVRVFPPDAGVLLGFADRLANEVVRPRPGFHLLPPHR
jgi:recyclin-1